MKIKQILGILGCLAALLGATNSYATTKTWVSGATWNTAIWSPTGNPVSGDDVILPTGASITSLGATVPTSGSFNSLTLNGTAALTVNNGFSVSGLTTISGSIIAGNNSGTR